MDSCVDERHQYSGMMTSPDADCADWSELYDQHREHPMLNDLFDINNFPDETFALAGNKCR